MKIKKIKKLASRFPPLVSMVHYFRHKKAVLEIQKIKEGRLPLNIIIGSSGTHQNGWISTEKRTFDMLNSKSWEKLLDKHSVDNILAEHVFEHLTEKEGKIAVKTSLTFLKKGGNLRIAVPDSFHPSKKYRDYCKPGGIGPGASDHKVFYNFKTFTRMLLSFSEFIEIEFLEYYDNGKLHQKYMVPSKGIIERTVIAKRKVDGIPGYSSSLIVDITLREDIKDEILQKL